MTTPFLTKSPPYTSVSGSRGTATTSPPHNGESKRLYRTQRPPSASASPACTSASAILHIERHQVTHEEWYNQCRHRNYIIHDEQPLATRVKPLPAPTMSLEGPVSAIPRQVSRRERQRSSLSLTPEAPQRMDGHNGRGDLAKSSALPTSNKTLRSSTVANNLPSAPFHQQQQQTQAPSPTGHWPMAHRFSMTMAGPGSEAVDKSVVVAPAPHKAGAQLGTKKESHRQGVARVQRYVAQTAYTQRNPFRTQSFEEFVGNPQYHPPPGFDSYSQAIATRVYSFESSRISQGDLMMRSLLDAAHPSTAEERGKVKVLLSSTLEKLKVGDWFYKWTRVNHVQRRYVWLNLQRGTLMWSSSAKKSAVFNSEVKLSTVMSVTPECLQVEMPVRFFYRMSINTQDRCISLATEIRNKFDVWYHVLLQLTVQNSACGVPGVWGRPSNSVNAAGWGTASRWTSRYSPLAAIMDNTPGANVSNEAYANGVVSSSD
ncbi:putative Meiotic cell cortex C-terminal pleckstriny [Leishmania shawi]|uniref:Meiotic cell cortex C-terminal pleckstriny n=1 Tax=Leishmania shawi TaxID=5680 RepID=A0AAW3BN88_9TRYP